jgi:hypothetical protein
LSQGSIGPASLGFAPYDLPTFSLPPLDLNKVRLIHGSCRKAHAEGRDALEAVAGMISTTVGQADQRPHQMFFTGDQIYADDVADALLFMAGDAAQALGFATETVTGVTQFARPGSRGAQVRAAGITTDLAEAKSHLITRGEFMLTYLFAWSEVLWQGNDMPDYTTVTGKNPGPRAGNTLFGFYQRELDHLRLFASRMSFARQALANVPTYMICDDHEVTDDWFLDRDWVNHSFTNSLMQRIVQNGMSAYAMFQGWGNTPERFEAGQPGDTLITALTSWSQSPTDENGKALRNVLGLPKAAMTDSDVTYQVDSNAMKWHYVVKGPAYQVLVLDSRTRRGYPAPGVHNHPQLLSPDALTAELSLLAPAGPEEVILVIAPGPVLGLDLIESVQLSQADPYPDDVEVWNGQPLTLNRLLSHLTTLGPTASGTRNARIVLLSGDVHYGFSARLRYSASNPLDGGGKTEAVFAQFTASAFKNEDLSKPFQHHPAIVRGVLVGPVTRYGWNNPPAQGYKLGSIPSSDPTFPFDEIVVRKPNPAGSPIIYDREGTFIPSFPSSSTPDPDWRYRITFIASQDDKKRFVPAPATQSIDFPPPGNRSAAFTAYLGSVGNHSSYTGYFGAGKYLVGVNNVGEISFQWGAGDAKSVTHELWWWLDDLPTPFPLTKHKCDFSLQPENI